jgi:hypothetical protein
MRQAGRQESFLHPGGRGSEESRRIDSIMRDCACRSILASCFWAIRRISTAYVIATFPSDLAYGVLKRDHLLRAGLRGIKRTNVVKILEFINNTLPFTKREQDCFAALLFINDVFWMQCNHILTSTAKSMASHLGRVKLPKGVARNQGPEVRSYPRTKHPPPVATSAASPSWWPPER